MNLINVMKVAMLILAAATMNTCKSAQENIQISKNQDYRSNSGIFSLKIPSDLSLGPKLNESNNAITILDDLGGLYRIEYIKLSKEFLTDAESKKASPLEILQFFSVVNFFEKGLLTAIPNSKLISNKSYEGKNGIYHLMLLFIPGGSSFSVNGKRSDIHRGVVTVKIDGYIFLVHTQEKMSILGKMPKLSVEELEKDLFSRGLSLIDSIQIN
ncbi:hypothetical protein EHQ52_15335 [Leptospira koniambonensis]|uniref:Uncharacterized protein n=1 Tax=Leptospira koniambonensis TaxID=2484950 RepID=A0A4R9J2U0_9LEPT|nr:hypothetical protein [Leptospira koniambonensis]TGL31309.1 hypothetical protein EHQ52_15335 [Leptospira koniambonensis]